MWLALRFAHWALDCRDENHETPVLVVELVARRRRIIAANTRALSAGVRLGMDLAEARLRLAALIVYERSPAAETAALARLAGWAFGYSHQIHWAIADGEIDCARLTLEIGASLRLFGGRHALLARIRDDLKALGYRFTAGIGNSPQAALAFTQARRVRNQRSKLESLPIDCLALGPRTNAVLKASGIRQTGELLALPADTLGRRFGTDVLDYLERLRGRRPHGLTLYHLPPRYRTSHELAGAVESSRELTFVLRRVFRELAVFLRGSDSAIQTLRLNLVHERRSATPIVLRLAAPSRDAEHLERVAQERLDRLELTAPVLEIELISDRLRPAEHHQAQFWRSAERSACPQWTAVLDRLRARLGHNAIRWLAAPAGHRPEHASALSDAAPKTSTTAPDADPLPRPFWLLDRPIAITSDTIAAIRWISGPERIESGWWAQGQRRDYYRAVDATGRLLWVFQDLDAARRGLARYYLHGLFG